MICFENREKHIWIRWIVWVLIKFNEGMLTVQKQYIAAITISVALSTKGWGSIEVWHFVLRLLAGY